MTKPFPRATANQQERGYQLNMDDVRLAITQSNAYLDGVPVSVAGEIESEALIMALIDLGYIA